MYFNAIREKNEFTVYGQYIAEYKVCLKTLLQQGISETVFFYDESFYKFKRIIEELIKRITKCYKRVGYNMDIM